MNTYLTPLLLSLLMLFSGCALFRSADDNGRVSVSVFSGLTETYDVEVRITEVDGRCNERRITLHRLPRLHLGPTVQHVEAYDRNCTGEIDRLRFRFPEDARSIDRNRLVEDIWHAFYRVVPVDRHMG